MLIIRISIGHSYGLCLPMHGDSNSDRLLSLQHCLNLSLDSFESWTPTNLDFKQFIGHQGSISHHQSFLCSSGVQKMSLECNRYMHLWLSRGFTSSCLSWLRISLEVHLAYGMRVRLAIEHAVVDWKCDLRNDYTNSFVLVTWSLHFSQPEH